MSERGVCIVTGGSRGIGAATARLAAGQGYAVAIFYRERSAEAQDVVRGIEAAGGRAAAVRADVGDEASLMRGFELADGGLGRLELLVNNAGIVGSVGRLETVTASMLESLVRTNVV